MVQFKQRKASRKVRERTSRLEDDGESSTTAPPPPAKRGKKLKPAAVLSFADEDPEEEEEVFQSTKRQKQKEKQRRRMREAAASAASALEQEMPRAVAATASRHGEYTKEKLAQLREGTAFLTPVVAAEDVTATAAPKEVVTEDLCADDSDMEMAEAHDVVMGESQDDAVLQGVQMSHSMVEHARRKRARMREIGGAGADFIPLGEDQEMTSVRFTRSSADQDLEPDKAEEETALYGRDMRSRIGFGDPGKRDERKERQKSLRELQDEEEDLMDDDEEVRQWEMERMKHGAQVRAKGAKELTREERKMQGMSLPALKERKADFAIRSVADFQAELSGHIGKVEEGLDHLSSRLRQVTSKVEEERAAINGINGTLADVGEQFRFFQKIRTYVKALMACVDHMMPSIVELEDKLMDADEAEQDLNLQREGEHLRYWRAIAHRGEVLDHDMGEGTVDELGRDSRSRARLLVQEEISARMGARAEKERRALAAGGAQAIEPEGYSSEEEYDDDVHMPLSVTSGVGKREAVEAVEREREELQSRARDLFNEVEGAYCELKEIKAIFQQWKSSFRDSYDSTYCESSLAEVYSPFVRVQVMLWRPLSSDTLPIWLRERDESRDISMGLSRTTATAGLGTRAEKPLVGNNYTDLEWFRTIAADITPEDQEWAVVRKLLEEEVAAAVKHIISTQWNPFSRRQTKRLLQVLSSLASHLPKDSGVMDSLRIRAIAVLGDASSALGALSQCPRGAAPQQMVACERLFWTHVKLLSVTLSFVGVVPNDSVSPLVSTQLESILSFCGAPSTPQGLLLLDRAMRTLPLLKLLQLGTTGDVIRIIEALALQNPPTAEQLLHHIRSISLAAEKTRAAEY